MGWLRSRKNINSATRAVVTRAIVIGNLESYVNRTNLNRQSTNSRSTYRRIVHCAIGSLLVLFSMLCSNANAQLTQPSVGGTSSTPLGTTMQDKSNAVLSSEAMISDGAINPKEYHLGPGDILQVQIWSANQTLMLTVAPDLTLIVPHIGEFNVLGKTLQDVVLEIKGKATSTFSGIKASSHTDPISVSLLQPRKIFVKVQGDVVTPNIFTLPASARADIAIDWANKPAEHTQPLFADEATLRSLDRKKRETERLRPYLGVSEERTASERYITVTHGNGTTERIDLLRYNATHEPRFCPLLQDGDVIYVPFKHTYDGMIGVYGAVMAPGNYEFVEGDSLYQILRSVYGPSPAADLTRVELTRMSKDGLDFTTEFYDVTAIQAHKIPDVPLRKADRIFVRADVDHRELSRVTIEGEVLYPGVYPIRRTDTKLSDLVRSAGGFTPEAFLKGGIITRGRMDADNRDVTPEDEALKASRLANLSVSDTTNFKLQTLLRDGTANVDLDRLFRLGDSTADLALRNNDYIYIPKLPNTVYVWGYVGRAGHIRYVPNQDVYQYIKSAGGFAEGAVESGTRIIKAGTWQWMEPKQTVIEPGDQIYVPKSPDHSEDYTLRTVGAIAGIVGAVVGIVISILYYSIATKK
jgi:protein involved in polysaccharide export with SLBB domain